MNKNHEKLQIKSMMSAQKSWNSHRVTDKSHGAFPSRNHKPTPISRRRRLQKGCSGQQQGRPTSIVDLWSSGPRGADWGAAWPFEDGRWRRNRRRMMMMMEGDGIVIIGSLVIRLVSSGLLSVAILRCHSASVYRTKSRNLVAWQGRRVVHGGGGPATKLYDYVQGAVGLVPPTMGQLLFVGHLLTGLIYAAAVLRVSSTLSIAVHDHDVVPSHLHQPVELSNISECTINMRGATS